MNKIKKSTPLNDTLFNIAMGAVVVMFGIILSLIVLSSSGFRTAIAILPTIDQMVRTNEGIYTTDAAHIYSADTVTAYSSSDFGIEFDINREYGELPPNGYLESYIYVWEADGDHFISFRHPDGTSVRGLYYKKYRSHTLDQHTLIEPIGANVYVDPSIEKILPSKECYVWAKIYRPNTNSTFIRPVPVSESEFKRLKNAPEGTEFIALYQE